MKMNRTGRYEVLDDRMFIKDPDTGERMFFLLDEEEKVVFRSMLEEDIKKAVNILKVSRSEKRKKMKFLWNSIPRKGSESVFFVVEKILETDESNPYERDRKIIGLAIRTQDSIEASVSEDEYRTRVLEQIKKLACYFGIEGVPFFQAT